MKEVTVFAQLSLDPSSRAQRKKNASAATSLRRQAAFQAAECQVTQRRDAGGHVEMDAAISKFQIGDHASLKGVH